MQITHKIQHQKQTNSLIKKWAEDLIGHFSEEGMQMANRHMKGCSISPIFSEMQIKTTITYHLTLIRMAIVKNTINSSYW